MSTDIKLLPLPEEEEEEWNVRYGYYADAMREYARANVAHATAPLQAEIEALKVDVEAWKASHSMLTDTCHHFQARAKRLAETLQKLAAHARPTCSVLWREAQAALRDHDQEEGE